MVKTSQLLFAFAFLVLLSVGFGSAAITSIADASTTDLSNEYLFSFTVNSTSPVNVSIATNTSGITVSPLFTQLAFNDTYNTSTVSGKVVGFENKGDQSVKVTVNTSDGVTEFFVLSVSGEGLCRYGQVGTNLSITDFNINNNGEGEDNDWYYLDDVEIEVEVHNSGDKKISDVYVELAIFSGDTDVTDDFDLEDDKISLGSIKDDDEEIATFIINNVPIKDIEEGEYTVKVKAYIRSNEDSECVQDFESIDVTNPFGEGVIVNGGALNNLLDANAGDSTEASFDVTNVGADKEKEVLIVLYNTELGIYEKYNVNDLRAGDSETITFANIEIPETAKSKTYGIMVETYFDYDEGDTSEEFSYDQDSYDDLDDDYNIFTFSIRVAGDDSLTNPTITAVLNSTAKVNEELIVKISVKSNSAQSNAFVVSADGYSSWADFVALDSSTMTISAQGTGVAVLKLTPTEAGQQTFNVKVLYNGKTIEQPITVTVANADSGFFGNLSDKLGKTTAYLIVAIIILVIIILLVLIVRAIVYLIRRA